MSEDLMDRDFVIYSEQYCSLKGQIRDRQLYLESNVYGDDYDSEQHIEFTPDDTEKLFSLMSFEEFIGFLREKRLRGFNEFLASLMLCYNLINIYELCVQFECSMVECQEV